MSQKFACGAGLIEVLVASVVLATGVLSMLSLQASAFGIGLASTHRQQAALLLMELTELVQLDDNIFKQATSLVLEGNTVSACVPGSSCMVDEFVADELSAWVHRVKLALPAVDIDVQQTLLHGQAAQLVHLSWYGPALFAQNSMQVVLP